MRVHSWSWFSFAVSACSPPSAWSPLASTLAGDFSEQNPPDVNPAGRNRCTPREINSGLIAKAIIGVWQRQFIE
jgi:hypothetical protein